MKTMDGFAEAALVSSSSVEGNELDAWLQRYQLLRSNLYGVAETPAEYVVVRPTLYLETTMEGLIPDSRRFIEDVRLVREVAAAQLESDIDRYNADARRRARALGLPVDSFVRHDPREAPEPAVRP